MACSSARWTGNEGRAAKPRSRKPSGTPRNARGKAPSDRARRRAICCSPAAARAGGARRDGARRRRLGARRVPRAARRPRAAVRGAADRAVTPTPFQRDVSDAHVRKLTRAMDKTKRFLDPIIVVRKRRISVLTPNGNHRLTALKELGAKLVVGLLVPEYAVAYQILALNIEKAHNLRERALEVRRMYRDLVADRRRRRGDVRARVRGAGAGHARLRLRAARPALGRRVPPGAAQGRPLGAGQAARRRRRARARARRCCSSSTTRSTTRSRAQGARAEQPVPAQLRGRAHQPAALHQGRAAELDELLATMTKRARGMEVEQDQDRGRRAHGRRARSPRMDPAPLPLRAVISISTGRSPTRRSTSTPSATRSASPPSAHPRTAGRRGPEARARAEVIMRRHERRRSGGDADRRMCRAARATWKPWRSRSGS